MNSRDQVPLWHLSLRNPRDVLLLNPFQLPLVVGLLTAAVVFTFWPAALDHAPVSFERRGVVHHIWHYALLAGAATTLAGMLSAGTRRLRTELVGLCVLIGAMGINLLAVIADAVAAGQAVSGFTVAVRASVIVGLLARAYIVTVEPTVDLRSPSGK